MVTDRPSSARVSRARTPLLALSLPVVALVSLGAVTGAAAPKRSPVKKKPAPSASANEPPSEPSTAPKKRAPTHVELAICPREALTDLDGEGLVLHVRKRCRSLRGSGPAAPIVVDREDTVVAICVNEKEAIEPAQCTLGAAVSVEGANPAVAVALALEGELALSLPIAVPADKGSLRNGAELTVTAQSTGWEDELKVERLARGSLRFRRSVDAYGNGVSLWLPPPMFTSDFSLAANGYRFGITPISLASGFRVYPGAGRFYLGFSAFVGWNLLIPNDVTTLSATTRVHVNYEAIDGGLLFDLGGYVDLGAGVGHTFTSDARTDFRAFVGVGPKLLGWFTDW